MKTRYKDIIVALVRGLRTIDSKIEIETSDIEEGFSRPSFFIELDNIKVNDFMKQSKITAMTVRMIYFPRDKYKNQIELLDISQSLEELFIENNYIEILSETDDRDAVMVEVENGSLDTNKGILRFQFDITLDEYYIREDNHEKMENLEID